MDRLKYFLPLFGLLLFISSCNQDTVIDTNMAVAENSWTYAKSTKAAIVVADSSQAYQVFFKLRHTSDYRYSNLFVVMRLKGPGLVKNTRYQFKLAKSDGEWLGKGSGDIYTASFPLLNDYRFAKTGTYQVEIEQNMRDNPLLGISDVGITVVKKQ